MVDAETAVAAVLSAAASVAKVDALVVLAAFVLAAYSDAERVVDNDLSIIKRSGQQTIKVKDSPERNK